MTGQSDHRPVRDPGANRRSRASAALRAGMALPWLGALVGIWGLLAASGVLPGDALKLTVVVVLQGASGWVLWTWASTSTTIRSGPVVGLGMGMALGTALCTVTGLLWSLMGWGPWGWGLVPAAVVAASMVRRGDRRPVERGPKAHFDGPLATALAAGSLLAIGAWWYSLREYPLSWTGRWSGYHSDMAFFEALSTSLARLGPLDSIFVPSGEIRYHWLAYAWSGQVAGSSAAEPFVVLTRVLPLVAAFIGVTLVAGWVRRLSDVPWAPTVAVALLVLGGHLGVLYGGVLPQDSPSQAMSAVWLLAFAFAISTYVQGRSGSPLLLACIGVLAFAVMGGKVSAGVPAVAGSLLVAGVGIARRMPWRREALIAAAITTIASVAAFVLVISGSAGAGGLGLASLIDKSSSQQGLNPLEGSLGVLAGTAIVVLGVGARWSGLAWLLGQREWRWRPEVILGAGFALSSVAAIVALSGFNEIWFAASASAPLAVLAAVGAGEASRRVAGDTRRDQAWFLARAIAGAAVVNVVVWLLWLTGASGGNVWTPTWRWAAPIAGFLVALAFGVLLARRNRGGGVPGAWLAASVVVLVLATVPGRLLGVGTGQVGVMQPGFRGEWFTVAQEIVTGNDASIVDSWSDSQMAAGRWLRENAGPGELLATNLTFSPFVPAVTGMQTYVSGIRYQAPYGRPDLTPTLLEHDAQVFAFLREPSPVTAAPLCEAGVRWLWVDPRVSAIVDLRPWAVPERSSPDVVILRMVRESCGQGSPA